jgi:hypothetical protein
MDRPKKSIYLANTAEPQLARRPFVELAGTSLSATSRRQARQAPDPQQHAQLSQHQLPALVWTIPDLLIDGRFLSTALRGVGASLLRGTRTFADVKAKSRDDKYPAERSGLVCAVVIKRQQEVNEKVPQEARGTRPRAGHSTRRHRSIPERTQRWWALTLFPLSSPTNTSHFSSTSLRKPKACSPGGFIAPSAWQHISAGPVDSWSIATETWSISLRPSTDTPWP